MEAVLAKFAEYGLAGIIIAYLIWRDIKKDTLIETRDAAINLLHEKRVAESAESVRALGANAAANSKMGEAMEALSESIERIERAQEARR